MFSTGRPTSRPQTVPSFEREFGCRVRYGIYESNEEMLARVMSGNSGWDVVFPTDYLIEPMRREWAAGRDSTRPAART